MDITDLSKVLEGIHTQLLQHASRAANLGSGNCSTPKIKSEALRSLIKIFLTMAASLN